MTIIKNIVENIRYSSDNIITKNEKRNTEL